MYLVSQSFKDKVYLDYTKHLLKVYIDGQEIEGKYIYYFAVEFDLFDDKFCFGATPSAQIELKIDRKGLPSTYNEVYVETGIDDEIVPIGTYRLEEIKKTDYYTVTIKALDYMTKFEYCYDGSQITLPATLKQVLEDICLKAGVELRFYFFFESG